MHWSDGLTKCGSANGLYFADRSSRSRNASGRSHASPDATRRSSRAAIVVMVSRSRKNVEPQRFGIGSPPRWVLSIRKSLNVGATRAARIVESMLPAILMELSWILGFFSIFPAVAEHWQAHRQQFDELGRPAELTRNSLRIIQL